MALRLGDTAPNFQADVMRRASKVPPHSSSDCRCSSSTAPDAAIPNTHARQGSSAGLVLGPPSSASSSTMWMRDPAGVSATKLVVLAMSGGSPAARSSGKVMKLDPPATAFSAPASSPPRNSPAAVSTSISTESPALAANRRRLVDRPATRNPQ